MKKFILPVAAVATLAFTSCGGGSDLEDALKDLQSEMENATENLEKEMEDVIADVEETIGGDVFTSTDGAYEIVFPGTPSGTDQSAPTAVGDIKIHMDMYEGTDGAWGVSYNDYPAALVEGQDGLVLLNEALGGATTSMGLDVEDSKVEGEFMGYPSIDYRGRSSASGFHNVYKLVLKDNRLYQAMILKAGSYATDAEVNNFFGTFKLTGLDM